MLIKYKLALYSVSIFTFVGLLGACKSRKYNGQAKSSFVEFRARGVRVVENPDPAALPRENDTLAALRDGIVLPHLTLDEKKRVVEQALLLTRDLYVHTEQKRKTYGDAVWAVPRLLEVKKRIESIDDVMFHSTIADIFTTQRDLHLNYYMPQPYACYSASLPFSFDKTREKDGTFSLRVAKLLSSPSWKPEFAAKVKAAQGDVAVGAKVETYAGKSPFDALRGLLRLSPGSAVDAWELRAMQLMTNRRGRSLLLPEEDMVSVSFVNPDGKSIAATIPWFAIPNAACLDEATALFSPKPVSPGPSGKMIATGGMSANDARSSFTPSDHFLAQGNAHARQAESDTTFGIDLKASAEPILKWGRIGSGTTPGTQGDLGYVRLDNFSPSKLSNDDTIGEFGNILRQLADTKGLIIDLRDNGGGDISFAEGLVSLFLPRRTKLEGYRMLGGSVSRTLIAEHPDLEDMREAARATAQGASFINGPAFSSPAALDATSQAYFQPVTLLVNPGCYSSCDMFTAIMQDNRAAIVWGQDGWQSGAGGANVWRHSSLLKDGKSLAPSLPFAPLPKNMDMRVSLRQMVRAGANLSELLEDVGPRADRVVMRTIEDLGVGADAQVLATLAAELRGRASRMTAFPAAFEGAAGTFTDLDFPSKGTFSLAANLHGATRVTASLDSDTKALAVNFVPSSSAAKAARAAITGKDLGTKFQTLRLDAFGPRGEQIARLRRNLRGIPPFLPVAAGATVAGSMADDIRRSLTFYKQGQGEGWLYSGGVLKTNIAGNYPKNMRALASLFARLPTSVRSAFSVDVEGFTEPNFDFFALKAVSGGEATVLPLKASDGKDSPPAGLSGEFPRTTWTADLSAFAGKDVEIRMEFLSDSLQTDAGVTIHGWTLETK
jgi:C-terminal processing protease CtpA/Prc